MLLLRRSQHNLGSTPPQVVLHSLNSLLLMTTAKPAKLMVEKVVLHRLLLVLRMLAEHALSHSLPCNVEVVLLNSLLLNLHMLKANAAKLIAETAVPHSLLLVPHMLAEHACSQHAVPTCRSRLLLMLRGLTTVLIVDKVVPHSLLLVFQMGQNSSKGIGAWHLWHTLKFPPSQDGVQRGLAPLLRAVQ